MRDISIVAIIAGVLFFGLLVFLINNQKKDFQQPQQQPLILQMPQQQVVPAQPRPQINNYYVAPQPYPAQPPRGFYFHYSQGGCGPHWVQPGISIQIQKQQTPPK